jgi:hypothetical protein
MGVTTLAASAALTLALTLPHAAKAVVYADVGALWFVHNPQHAYDAASAAPSISLSGDGLDSAGNASAVLAVNLTDNFGIMTRSLSDTKSIFISNSDPSFTGQQFTLVVTLSPIWPMILTVSNPNEESASAAVRVGSEELIRPRRLHHVRDNQVLLFVPNQSHDHGGL